MKTALVVDDSSYMRLLIKRIINRLDYQVAGEAENGKLGVEKYKELKPDLVIMDIMMDEMTGLEALKEIMEYDSGARVVMISSALRQDFIDEEAKSLGAKAVLLKPPDEISFKNVIGGL